jgi:CheY-like chemotaxis protein
MKILILDDDEIRQRLFKKKYSDPLFDLTQCYDVKSTIENLKTETYDYIFLDHDLGSQQMVDSGDNTGYEVAVWINENLNYIPRCIYIHSLNPAGRKNMVQVLENKFNVIERPFMWE